MNKVILIGNVANDIKLTESDSGVKFTGFSLAVRKEYAVKEGERDSEFINIIAWRTLGERIAQYVKKGDKIGICGRLQTRTYEKDGQKRYVVEVIADSVEFLGKKQEQQDPSLTPITDENLPF